MYRSCSKCGMIHDTNYKCKADKRYKAKYSYEESKLRNTYAWHTKAEQIKKDSKYLCSMCYLEGKYNYNDLEVHHIVKIREDKTKLLDNYNLVCLCKRHHRLADSEMIDKDKLFELARQREDQKIK